MLAAKMLQAMPRGYLNVVFFKQECFLHNKWKRNHSLYCHGRFRWTLQDVFDTAARLCSYSIRGQSRSVFFSPFFPFFLERNALGLGVARRPGTRGVHGEHRRAHLRDGDHRRVDAAGECPSPGRELGPHGQPWRDCSFLFCFFSVKKPRFTKKEKRIPSEENFL